MKKKTEQKIEQRQMLEQSMQNFMLQKQQFQAQLLEIESALKELEGANTAYKIIGNIMINAEKDVLKKDLEEKKEKIELRIKTLEKQEGTIKDKASSMQSEVLGKLNK